MEKSNDESHVAPPDSLEKNDQPIFELDLG
jgi:hypothetical protein